MTAEEDFFRKAAIAADPDASARAEKARAEFALKSANSSPESAVVLVVLALLASVVCWAVLAYVDSGFQSDIVYTHLLSRMGQLVALLLGCLVAMLGVASKLWDIGNTLKLIASRPATREAEGAQ